MSKHKATKATTNWKAWRRYLVHLLANLLIQATKPNNKTKKKQNNTKQKTK